MYGHYVYKRQTRYLYEEFSRLAETRLAQNILSYLKHMILH